MELDCLFNNGAQLVEDFFFVTSVAASMGQTWSTSDVALILFRPLDDLYVLSTVFRFLASSIASCTARSNMG